MTEKVRQSNEQSKKVLYSIDRRWRQRCSLPHHHLVLVYFRTIEKVVRHSEVKVGL